MLGSGVCGGEGGGAAESLENKGRELKRGASQHFGRTLVGWCIYPMAPVLPSPLLGQPGFRLNHLSYLRNAPSLLSLLLPGSVRMVGGAPVIDNCCSWHCHHLAPSRQVPMEGSCCGFCHWMSCFNIGGFSACKFNQERGKYPGAVVCAH